MPELPEVETVVRGLRSLLIARTIVGVSVGWPRTIARPEIEEFARRIVGRRVASVGRRGKYVVLGLDRDYLLVHLKMSGQLQVVRAGEPMDKHVHLLLDLDDGRQLRFRDVRKFGRVYLVADPAEVTARLGPEPLSDDFTLAEFRRLLSHRSGRLKPLLLNQQFLAGLGNIYADETLFAAHLHPLRKADSLTPDEQARLYEAIRSVLKGAVDGRGTTQGQRLVVFLGADAVGVTHNIDVNHLRALALDLVVQRSDGFLTGRLQGGLVEVEKCFSLDGGSGVDRSSRSHRCRWWCFSHHFEAAVHGHVLDVPETGAYAVAGTVCHVVTINVAQIAHACLAGFMGCYAAREQQSGSNRGDYSSEFIVVFHV